MPLAENVDQIEGTPRYMAPEMAAAQGERIDERTDVYLLGATLHDVLAGRPPHRGESLRAVLEAAFTSKPQDYPAGAPRELGAHLQARDGGKQRRPLPPPPAHL